LDFKWVLAARAGYELAFDELVSRNKGRVHRLSLAITQEPAAADTVLRAAFREAHNRPREFQRTSAFSRWVLGIATMQALQRLREERSDATVFRTEGGSMSKSFRRGDHVEWNSEAGKVRGVVLKKTVSNVRFKGYVHHASRAEPQYFIKSDKTDHVAIHKGPALRLLSRKKRGKTKARERKKKIDRRR
jgi:hypothetical protein